MFANDKEKQDALTHLPSLKEHPGWKFIERALDENIAYISKQLRERKDFANLEEVFYTQQRITDIEAFKTLPETIIESAKPDPEEEEEEEIYETPGRP